MSFSWLSEGTIIDIFLKLPLNSLARVRQVCKSWCSLTTKINGINHNPFILFDFPSHVILHALNLHGNWNDPSSLPHTFDIINYPFMNQQQPQVFKLLDSCNGLLCIRAGRGLDFHVKLYGRVNANDSIYLWNPSNNEFKTVPNEPIEFLNVDFDSLRVTYKFGCNRKMNDYKLIRTVLCFGGIHHMSREIKIYTLLTNSWRRINEETIPTDQPQFLKGQDAHINGVIHWISYQFLEPEIVSFDIEDEKYKVVPKPNCVDNVEMFVMDTYLLVLRGCLCIYSKIKNGIELWMMKDYGVKESWTKLFKTTYSTLKKNRSLKVLWLCKNGKILMVSKNEDFIMYDPEKDEAEYVQMDRNHIKDWFDAELYIDNSMSLES